MVFIDTDPETGELIFQPEGREAPFRVPPDLVGGLPGIGQQQQPADTGVLPQAQARQAAPPAPQLLAIPEEVQPQELPEEAVIPTTVGAPPISSEVPGSPVSPQLTIEERALQVEEAERPPPSVSQPPPRVADVDGVPQVVESLPVPELPRASSIDLSIQEEADAANLTPRERLKRDRERREVTVRRLAELRAQQQEGIAVKAEELTQAQKDADIAAEKVRNTAVEKATAVRAERQKVVQEIADTEINPERYWANVSTEKKIIAIISAGLAGFLNPRGGRNPMVEAVQAAIDRDIQAQIQDRGNKERALDKRSAIEEGEIASDFGKAKDIEDRSALAWTRFGQLLKIEAQKFDPALTQAQTEVGLAEAQAQTSKAYQNIEQIELDNELSINKAAESRALTSERIKSSRAQRGLARSREQRARLAEARAARFEQIKASEIIEKDVLRSPFTGEVLGSVATVSESERKDLRERIVQGVVAVRKTKQLMLLFEEHGAKYDGPGQKFLQTPEGKLMTKVHAEIVTATALARKGPITKSDVDRAILENPVDTFFAKGARLAQEDTILSIAESIRERLNAVGLDGSKFEAEMIAMPRFADTSSFPDTDLQVQLDTDPSVDGRMQAMAAIGARLGANDSVLALPNLEQSVRRANTAVQKDEFASSRQKADSRSLMNRTLTGIARTREKIIRDKRNREANERRAKSRVKIPQSIQRKREIVFPPPSRGSRGR